MYPQSSYAHNEQTQSIHVHVVGKMAQCEILWCHSHLVWLVLEGSIPSCACFHSENLFVTSKHHSRGH